MGLSNSIPADVSGIERELQRQWQAHAFRNPVVRTRSLNLVVVSPGDETPTGVIEQLTEAHPCRAILINMGAKTPDFLAEVSSSCAVAHAGAGCLTREEVCLRVPYEVESGKLESVVVPLLVPDLPVFLWWRSRPDLENELFTRLASHSDHFVLDSAECEDPWMGLVGIGHAIAGRRWRAAVTDLAWSRITAWRELTAQFFDNRQCAEYPAHICAVSIACGNGGRLPADAVLFAAWIARQLEWRATSETGASASGPSRNQRLMLGRNGNRREIGFVLDRSAARGLQSVRLNAESDKDATFVIQQTSNRSGMTTTTRLGAQKQIQRTVRRGVLTLAEMIGSEISRSSRDMLYEQVLGVVAEILRTTK